MIELITAEQMAKQLNMSGKTFAKRIRQYSIPFIDAGRKLFDPEKVLRSLETTVVEKPPPPPPEVPRGAARRGRDLVLEDQKYRKILGL